MWYVTLWVVKDPINSEETTGIDFFIDAQTKEQAIQEAKNNCQYSVYESDAFEI